MRQRRRVVRKERLAANYTDGTYWSDRMDLMYYHYVDYILRTLGRDAKSMIDIGTANCPYQEWFDWIPERVSFDQAPPYSSENVTGIQDDFLTYDFGRRFDVATCLQVLEHIPRAGEFMRRLLEISNLVIVSVPFMWPARMMDEHIHDPVSYEKLTKWAGREANFKVVVEEPFRARKRLIAVFDADEKASYGKKDFKQRVIRDRMLGS
ncbi:MAG: class I SAM-dependent methyltransferase [Rhodobacteraceae bacterium]|nr:class I SAM-dependent methyltransferase [Paracoccaceae bacterium]